MAGTHHSQHGFTLIELMVALLLGLLLLAAVTSMVAGASRGNRDIQRASQLLENGRYAVETLSDQLAHAGFYGTLYPQAAPAFPAVPGALPDPCATPATAAALTAGLGLHIQGWDNPTGDPPPSCISDADHIDGTDIIVMRRTATTTANPAQANATPNTFYLQTTGTELALDTGANAVAANGFGLTYINGNIAPLRPYQVDIFYLSPRTRPVNTSACDGNDADDGNATPTLMRIRLSDAGFCAEPLAAGIENMQLEYGIDTSGNGTPNQFEEQPDNPQEWADVMGVRIYLLVRTTRAQPGFNDDKTYLLGEGIAGPDGTDIFDPADKDFPRHVFTTTARLTNPSGRRERP